MKNNIIIAHYREDLNWFQNAECDCNKIVYSKTLFSGTQFNIPKNMAQEVPMYLKYMIDFYDSLPPKTLFLHGHSISQHQDFESRFICENVNWEADEFFSVNRRDWYQEVSKNYQLSKGSFDVWLKNYWYLFEQYLPFPQNGLFFYSGAQFVVSKELILSYPKNFWQRLYDWSINEFINIPPQTSDEISSRIFEYTWHYIFTKNAIEKTKDYNEIFKR